MKKIFLITVLIIFKINAIFAENIEIINDTEGDGLKVVNHSWVKIEYTGSFEDGTVFDTNVGKDKPLVFQIGMKEVIPGFEQGIVGANKGSKRKIKIPSMLAYGEKGAGELIPPNSNLIFEFKILDVLKDEGFISDYKFSSEDKNKGILQVYLKYNNGLPVIKEITRVSKPGRRIYTKAESIPRIQNGLGIAIVSTSKGIMTDNDARTKKIGGEIICKVF